MSSSEQPTEKYRMKKTGIKRLWNALCFSTAGLKAAYANKAAFRQEIWLAVALIPLALILPVSGQGKSLLITSVLLLIIVELLNSAIEAAVDRISLDQHELAKRAKDIGSAAVMVSLINLIVVWCLTLLG